MTFDDVDRAKELIVERERVAMLRRETATGKIAIWVCGSPQAPVFAEAARPAILAEVDRQIGAIDEELRLLGVEYG